VRLPVRHAAPTTDAPIRSCAYLDALLESAEGTPLRPVVGMFGSYASRGRYGNALQWHLGLEPHDGVAAPDWEGSIELKLVSVWRTSRGTVACDKLKVCDVSIDPREKLSNVAFVLVDRVTRVVVGSRRFRLAGASRAGLAARWNADPHFDEAPLFVESRGEGEKSAPAYYMSASWLGARLGLEAGVPGVYPFDSSQWTRLRAEGRGRDPLVSVLDAQAMGERHRCPRCPGTLHLDPEKFATWGICAASHTRGLGERCDQRGHIAVDGRGLGRLGACSMEELLAGIEDRVSPEEVWRLADRVREPDDHLHVTE
jgi:hypothetical protein